MSRPVYKNIDDYIKAFPEKTQDILNQLRQTVKSVEPTVTEGISYAIPTFYLNGKYLVYFAGFKNHVSVYPATTEAAEKAGLLAYKVAKGTLKFALDKPIPYELIGQFVKERVKEQNT